MAAMQPELPGVERYVLMDDRCPAPPALPAPSVDYEELLAAASERAEFPALDENMAAGMCYTSATTGDPKGVVYSHRSTFLHAMAGCMVDAGAMSEREVALPAVPMFHVNAWGMPYSCTMTGAKQVFPGSGLIGQPLAELLEAERVTCAAGVPTIWTLLYQHLKEKTYDLSSLHTLLVGGSAASRAMIENFQRDFGIRVLHAWGMTETSPLGTVSRLKRRDARLARGAAARGPAQAGHPDASASRPASSATTARTCPGTASTSASWPSAARGSRRATTTTPRPAPRSPPTAGSAPATWRASTATATSSSATARRT